MGGREYLICLFSRQTLSNLQNLPLSCWEFTIFHDVYERWWRDHTNRDLFRQNVGNIIIISVHNFIGDSKCCGYSDDSQLFVGVRSCRRSCQSPRLVQHSPRPRPLHLVSQQASVQIDEIGGKPLSYLGGIICPVWATVSSSPGGDVTATTTTL